MENEWMDFASIQLTKEKNEALYVQLYNELLQLIQQGRLGPGYALPPVRRFAAYLGINPGTVVNAYKELEKNGYLFARRGSGSFVAEPPEALEKGRINDNELDDLELPDPEILSDESNTAINMRSISLNPDIVSIKKFKEFILQILDRDQARAFGYQESQGFLPLRQSIASYLGAAGVHTDARHLQIISGAQQGIDIAARALLKHGDCVFTEAPTYPGALAAFRSRGAKIIDIPLEPDGIDLIQLENRLRQFHPRLLYIMPNIQNPSGISYSLEKRRRLMGLARYYDALVLEDDYISELTYGQKRLAPLKSIDRDDRIIYLKSFSKIFMPGLRLAFLCMPERLIHRFLQVKHLADISTSGLTQRVFDLYLQSGSWQQHIREIRHIYATRFDFCCHMAADLLPKDIHWDIPSGGLSLWLQLPKNRTAAELTASCRRTGLLITDGSAFYPRGTDCHHIRISFATLSLPEIEKGLQLLSRLLRHPTS